MKKERKLFFAWNMDKEKLYLEEKAKQGLKLIKIGFGVYYFEESEPEDVTFQFDFRMFGKKDEEEYLALYDEWELVQRYGGWYYFRKVKTSDVEDSIYSNVESKRGMFLRLIGFLLLVAFPLYYQLFFIFPHVNAGDISLFYRVFMTVIYVFIILHTTAVLRLLIIYAKMKKGIKQ